MNASENVPAYARCLSTSPGQAGTDLVENSAHTPSYETLEV